MTSSSPAKWPAWLLLAAIVLAGTATGLVAQAPAAPAAPSAPPPAAPPPNPGQAATSADHKNMMEQLGIKALRPGPSGRAGADVPNAANYDPAKANPFPDLPEVLTLKDGRKVTTPAMWWDQRRPEIVEDFEREVIGRVPKDTPKVNWEVTQTVNTKVGELPIVAKQLVGHVDNAAHPEITVEIAMVVVTPAEAKGPVPVLMMFGGATLPGQGGFGGRGPGGPPAGPGRGPGPAFADPVFRLLGVRDLGDLNDYRVATMPPYNTGMLDGELAWRQHDGGHEDRSNMKHFIAWANPFIKHTPPAAPAAAKPAQ